MFYDVVKNGFVGGCLLLLAACGSLPQPFAHSGPVKSNPLLALAGGGAVQVRVDPKLPESISKPLSESMVKSLWDEHIPASGAENFRPRYILNGALKINYPSLSDPEEIDVKWQLLNVDNTEIDTFNIKFAGDRAGWLFLDRSLLAVLTSDIGKDVVRALYAQRRSNNRGLSVPPSVQNKTTEANDIAANSQTDSQELPKKPRIFLAEIIGAPGDGNISLHQNLRRTMTIAGADIVAERSESNYLVKGFVNVSQPYGGANDVAITWLVTTKEGQELGKVSQNSKVPVGSLDGRWGEVAYLITQGASVGIIDVFERKVAPQGNKTGLIIQ